MKMRRRFFFIFFVIIKMERKKKITRLFLCVMKLHSIWYYLKESFKGVTLDRVRHVYSRVPAVVIQPFAFRDGGFFRG